jgi:hypothetical protein
MPDWLFDMVDPRAALLPDQGRRLVTNASAFGTISPPEDHRDSVTLV